MSLPTVTAGVLAFIGPVHALQLTRFCYVRVRSVASDQAVVQPVGPDQDNEEEFEMPAAALRFRLVSEKETELWPGYYVAIPVAFVESRGPAVGRWAYGVVTGYHMTGEHPILEVLHGDETVPVRLDESFRIIKVDHLNYALQVGVGMNATAMNGLELRARQDEICVVGTKRRKQTPKAVEPMLSVPFVPDDRVPLVHPATMEIVRVRRSHLVDTATQSSKRRAGSAYNDPVAAKPTPTATRPL